MPNAPVAAAATGLPEDIDQQIAELAELDFPAWTHSPREWTPPTAAEWAAKGSTITLRVAWLSLFKTKPELAALIRAVGYETAMGSVDAFAAAADEFESIAKVLRAAEGRYTSVLADAVVAAEAAATNAEALS